jgi:hypothetical protein
MDTLLLLLLFQLKHYLADFVFQTYQQTVRKGIYRDPIGISHTLEHVIGTLIVLFTASFFMPISCMLIAICGVLDLILHYHIDYVKVKYGIKDLTKPLFWNQFGIDQLAHQFTYLGFALLFKLQII